MGIRDVGKSLRHGVVGDLQQRISPDVVERSVAGSEEVVESTGLGDLCDRREEEGDGEQGQDVARKDSDNSMEQELGSVRPES